MANTDFEIKRKKKKKFGFGYLYLFLFIFLAALAFFSYMVDSLSPDIDVTIGNNDKLTLGESEMDVEIKEIDERLKWIQMEDELPSVAIRNPENKNKKEKDITEENNQKISDDDMKEDTKENTKKEQNKEKNPPRPNINDIKKPTQSDYDFRAQNENQNNKAVIPAPKPSVTKVYLGSYSTIDEAMEVQNKISASSPDITPFVKTQNSRFIVQLGSFSNKEKAENLVMRLKQQGYSPKINYEN